MEPQAIVWSIFNTANASGHVNVSSTSLVSYEEKFEEPDCKLYSVVCGLSDKFKIG